jgi:uncharacterized membrane protein (UPF0127 family)
MNSSSEPIPIWLLSNGNVLCSARLASDRAHRRKGLRGTDPTHEALVIERCRWVHSIGMSYPIDVAFLDCNNSVVAIHRLSPWRVDRPVKNAVTVIEAGAGSFDRWPLRTGDIVEVRHVTR